MEFSILVLGGFFELERAGRTRRACFGSWGAGLKFTAWRQCAFNPEARHFLAVGKKTKCHIALDVRGFRKRAATLDTQRQWSKKEHREFPFGKKRQRICRLGGDFSRAARSHDGPLIFWKINLAGSASCDAAFSIGGSVFHDSARGGYRCIGAAGTHIRDWPGSGVSGRSPDLGTADGRGNAGLRL